jgi:isocitrate lyase
MPVPAPRLLVRDGVLQRFPDVLTAAVLATLEALGPLNRARQQLMHERSVRRAERARGRRRIDFLDPAARIPGTDLLVRDARDGRFEGSAIPDDLQRQWIQGTGPATRPGADTTVGTRSVAYALLSGADGWMFDGEDALGQVGGMSLQNQRHLRLAFGKDGHFLRVAEQVAGEMNAWGREQLGRALVDDPLSQLDFTTRIFRPRGLHLDDRHVRDRDGSGYSASIVDAVAYVEGNHRTLRAEGRSLVLYLPKIQTAEEAALWDAILVAIEGRVGLPKHAIKTYVLVEQLEASFQLMEIRAALGRRFVGFNTGRWDYINSVSDAMAWDPEFQNPNIDAIGMTYAYMQAYEDRVRRAVNTPDANGRFALWQGGMEANIPVGSPAGVADGMKRAIAGAEREQQAGASGKWVAHWKMVPIVRPVWEKAGQPNQLGREFPRLTYTADDARALTHLAPAPRTVRGARDLISVAMQYANAFGQGYQAAALKPADFFGNDDVLYLMEDMATGEIRASVLWEWLHKKAPFTADDPASGVHAGDTLTVALFTRLLGEEYDKLRAASDRDVHDDSKDTTLPIARAIVDRTVRAEQKAPWYADLLYLNLENEDLGRARHRIDAYYEMLAVDGTRLTDNPDFVPPAPTPDSALDQEVAALSRWFKSPRFDGIERLHTAREVAEQRGTIRTDYTVAREAAEGFHARLRELYAQGRSITTFGPYSPGQAVAMKRAGIEGIYLGGWATSAKGNLQEDPGPDLASYPLSQVPDEAAPIVRALLTADRNQYHARARMTEEQRRSSPAVDFRPFIIADADTGHGGDAHVRNLVRRFVEVGVPGYHIEDQKPGVKKCGHQGGKVLVSEDEQIKRLSAARYQLDLMGVPGIIVARTDAESATLLDGRGDERDHPFIYGATNTALPTYKAAFLAILRQFYGLGVAELSGHRIYALCDEEYAAADAWLEKHGLSKLIADNAAALAKGAIATVDAAFDAVFARFGDLWQEDAGVKTYGEAVAAMMEFRAAEGETFPITVAEWLEFASTASFFAARSKAASMRLNPPWDCEHCKTPDGYYQVRGGIEYAIAKSLAVAPYADLLWMETKTADLHDARRFADAIHAKFPDKMLAYNLSPSFNWDTTGMNEEEMRLFPVELGKLGFVFNFITYGGHQIDGLAGEEFASALREQGMLALARLQRQFRLLESPYRTPQTLVGGPRADAALMSLSGRTSSTRAMGKGSTQFQHLVQTEVPPKLLEDWLEQWRKTHPGLDKLKVSLRPHTPGSDVLELAIRSNDAKVLNVVFATIHDRRGRSILSIRDQNTFDPALRRKRLMTLAQLFLIHRYKADAVHFVTPSADNQRQAEGMKARGVFASVADEVGEIIVADVDQSSIQALVKPGNPGFASIVNA